MVWPPRPPYLTPMDFSLWGHVKSLIFTSPVDSEEGLIARIVEAAATIRQEPGTFGHIRLSMPGRCRLHIEVVDRTFEHLL
jgi:hypothetical protein